jgi:hypothetical protein
MAQAFALSGTNLISFDTANPTSTSTTSIGPIAAGETLVGIDFRPQNGQLYALGVNATTNTATLYLITPRTGLTTIVGGSSGQIAFTTDGVTPVDLPDPSAGWSFDFNPLIDRIRVSAGALNFRVDPNTGRPIDGDNGGVATTGTNPDGPINGGTTTVNGVAYTNNVANATATTLYTLDGNSNSLFIQTPANSGTQTSGMAVTLNGATLDFNSINGFDIPAGVNVAVSSSPVTTGSALAVLNVGGSTGLYSINLVNAQATFVGNVGGGLTAVQGFAIQNDYGGIPALAINADGTNLVRFNTATPGTTTTIALAPASPGERLVAIDYRPQTGQLFGVGIDATANTGTLYLIDPQSGSLTPIGTTGQIAFVDAGGNPVDLPDPASAGYGMDFDPATDRVRVTTSTGLNFRINSDTGAPVDGNLGGAVAVAGTNPDGAINGSGSAGVSAAAYTNSYAGTSVRTAYTLDSILDTLFIQDSPNSGTETSGHVVTLGGSPLDFTSVNGFDIPPFVAVNTSGAPAFGFGYAALTVGGTPGLYKINLATGEATLLGALGSSFGGLTIANAPFTDLVVSGTQGEDIIGVPSAPFVAIDALGGIDTVNFGFALTDATVTYAGNKVIIETASQHIEVTGVERYVFTDGLVDNNDGSWLIDDLFYYSQNHDVWNAHVDADFHYNVVGWQEGRDPSAFFSIKTYLAVNPDVKAAAVNPLTHYDSVGWQEGRIPSLVFGTTEYLDANPDVKAAGMNPLFHFLAVGAGEGRLPIAPTEYLAPNGFDYVFYLQNNPDVAAAGIDPFFHFQVVGWTEGRDPNELFDIAGYLAAYTDVAAANINPLDHYHVIGFKEARDPSVNFDTFAYRSAYPDVAAANIDPLVHFLDIGRHEGKSAFADGVFG